MDISTINLQNHLNLLKADMFSLSRATRDRLGNSKQRALLFAFIKQAGICVACGHAADVLQNGHLISAYNITGQARAGYRGGYAPGNIGAMCIKCNKEGPDGQGGEITWNASNLARPDLVPLIWPIWNHRTGEVKGYK